MGDARYWISVDSSFPEQIERVPRRGTEDGIVEDAPDPASCRGMLLDPEGQGVEVRLVIGQVVDPRGAMQPEVDQLRPATRLAGRRRSRRIRGNTCDLELAEDLVRFGSEPACVSRLAGDGCRGSRAHRGEEGRCHAGLEIEAGRKLDQQAAEPVPQAG